MRKLFEHDVKQELLAELENELEKKQKERNRKMIEIEKLYYKKEIIKSVASEMKKEAMQSYLEFFDIENIEQEHERLRQEFYNYEENDPINYLKKTINALKITI